jgi:hypothetical protein
MESISRIVEQLNGVEKVWGGPGSLFRRCMFLSNALLLARNVHGPHQFHLASLESTESVGIHI